MKRQGRLIDLFKEYPSLLMLSVGTGITSLGQGVTAPILPLYARSFEVSVASVGLTIAVFGLARLVVNIPAGLLSDRIGRRTVLMGGSLILGLASVMCGLADEFWQLLIWRFVAGAGSAMFATTAYAILSDIGRPENRARMMSLNQGSLSLGQTMGPALGGIVAELLGLQAPFFVVGGLALLCALWSYSVIPESHTVRSSRRKEASSIERSGPRAGWWQTNGVILTSLPFFLLSMVTFTTFFTRSAGRQTILPLLGADRFEMSAGTLGLLFTIMAIIGFFMLPVSGTMADRFGRKATIIPSSLLSATSLVMIGLAGEAWFLVVGVLIQGMASGVSGPAPAAYAADMAPAQGRGFAMGLYRTYADAALVVGPPLAGWIADVTSFAQAMYFNAAVVASAIVAFALWAPETLRRGRSEEGEAVGRASPRTSPTDTA